MRIAIVFIALVLASAVPAYSQTTPQVPLNTPFQLIGDHDGVNTTGYRCYLDGKQVGADLPVPAGTLKVIACSFPAVTMSGAHSVSLAAFNASGEGRLDVPFGVPLPLPAKPTNPRIVVGGTVVLKGETVPAQFTLAVKVNKRTQAATLQLVELETQ